MLVAATPSSNSAADSQPRRSTHSSRSSAMCAGGPPNPMQPMRPHSRAIVSSGTRSPRLPASIALPQEVRAGAATRVRARSRPRRRPWLGPATCIALPPGQAPSMIEN